MGRKLAANVAVRNPATGYVETFAAGGHLPAWAAEQVTNDDVWASDAVEESAAADSSTAPAPAPKATVKKAAAAKKPATKKN